MLWVIPEARCAFYMAIGVVQALFSFIWKKVLCAYFGLFLPPECKPGPERFYGENTAIKYWGQTASMWVTVVG